MAHIKVAVAGVYHETNTFVSSTTGLDAFQSEWIIGRDAFFSRYRGSGTSMGGAIAGAALEGITLEPGLYVSATPSGMVSASAAEEILADIVDAIDYSADGLLLILHGAMVAESFLDMEGELLRR